MPNWCDTTYKCVGDKEQLRELYMTLQRMNRRKEPVIRNGFGNMWLGELVNELGYDWEKLRCRGTITGFSEDKGVLTIRQDTAWCEQEGVREAIRMKYPGITVYYSDEEPGCENYTTNDSDGLYFPERYLTDIEGFGVEYFRTLEEAAVYVAELTSLQVGPDKDSIQNALERYAELKEEDDDEIYCGFHEFRIVKD